jgi:hypothetical protein
MTFVLHLQTGRTLPTGITEILSFLTVQSLGEMRGESSFADSIYTGKQIGMADPTLSDSFF